MVSALTGAAMLALWVAERVIGRPPVRRAAPVAGRNAPPRFSPQQAARFTRTDGGARFFDATVATSILEVLRFRSANPIALPGVDARAGVWAWEICPLQGGRERAIEVVERAAARGMPLLGSLSLVLLKTGHPHEAILVVAQDQALAANLAIPAGEFAVLRSNVVETARAPAEPLVTAPPVATEAPPTEAPVVIGQVAKSARPKANGANGVQAPASRGTKDEPPSRAPDA